MCNALAVVHSMNVHLTTAISTIYQPGQRVGFTPSVWVSPDITPYTLYIIKSALIDYRLMGILKNHPLAFIYIMAFLVLEMLAGLEVTSMTEILTLFEDMGDGGRALTVNIFENLILVHALAVFC